MIKLSFKLDPKARFYKTAEFYSNGHWAVRVAGLTPDLVRAFRPVQRHAVGTYHEGYTRPMTDTKTPDGSRIFIQSGDYYPARLSGRANIGFLQIRDVELTTSDEGLVPFTVKIDPKYVPLLQLGDVFIKDSTSAILVKNLDQIVAAVMPIR